MIIAPRPAACVALTLALLMPVAANAQAPTAPASVLILKDAWVRTPAPTVPMTAGYLTIENPSAADVVITGASSVAANRIEMHEMRDENGRASMRMVDVITVPARGSVRLAPGGLHLMIMGMPRMLVAGDEVPITLKMRDGSVAIARAIVKAGS